MTRARDDIISLSDTPYYHCMARCVRRAFLFGEDEASGRSFDHRKAWIEDKLAFLGEVFAIDVCAYAVMSNHYHVVLHVDSDRVLGWSTREVIDRWMMLFSGHALIHRYLSSEEQSQSEIDKVLEIVELWRARLMDISWFMRVLNESIARMANEEDECSGRFWEGRFKSQALLDEAAVLACMAYVDLNPIRAGMADLPENSDHTSIQQRIVELANRTVGRPVKAPTKISEKSQVKPDSAATSRKCPRLYPFNQGTELKAGENALAFALSDYLELVDWTGRALREDKRGAIAERAPPILERIGFSPQRWLQFVPKVERSFCHAVGSPKSLRQAAQNTGVAWLQGQGMARRWYPQDNQCV